MTVNQVKPTKQQQQKPFYRRRWFSIGIILGGLAIAIISLLPYAIRYGIQAWAQQNGITEATIEDVDFNPFTGSFAIRELRFSNPSSPEIRVPALEVKLDWIPLWQRRAHLRSVKLQGARIPVIRGDTGQLAIGGIRIAGEDNDAPSAGPAWDFGIDLLRITDTQISYQDEVLNSRADINALQLTKLASWNPDQPAELTLDGAIDQAPLHVDGHILAFSNRPGFTGELHLDKLPLQGFAGLTAPQLSQLQGDVSIDSRLQAEQQQDGSISISQQGRFSLTGIEITGTPGEYLIQQLGWDGSIDLEITSGDAASTTLQAEGQLIQGPAELKPAGAELEYRDQGMQWQGRIAIDQGPDSTRLSLQGNFEHNGLDLTLSAPEAHLTNNSLIWKGRLDLTQADENLALDTKGDLTVDDLAFQLPARDLDLQQKQLRWAGVFGYGLEAGQLQLNSKGDLELGPLRLDEPEHQLTVLAFDGMQIQSIAVQDPTRFDIANLSVEGLRFARSLPQATTAEKVPPALLRTAHSSISRIRFAKSDGLSIHRIEHKDLKSILRRGADGELNTAAIIITLNDMLSSGTDDQPPATQPAASPTAPEAQATAATQAVPIRVDEALIVGDSSLTYVDENVSPPYSATLNFDKLKISDIDSSKPEQESPFDLEARLGEHATLTLKGKVRFFDKRVTASIGGRIEALELPPLSSYSAPAIGYNLASGQMDADIDIQIKQGQIQGKNRLIIHELEVAKLDPEQLKKYQVSTVLPLDTGLALLRDRDDNIILNLPISGDISNPEFNPIDVINQALATGMQQGARTYLAAAFFPFGTAIVAAEALGRAALEIRLDPVLFAPASATLDGTARAYLKKVAEVMGERPKMDIKICGMAVEADQQAMLKHATQQLKERQKKAGKAVQSALAKDGQKPTDSKKTAPSSADKQQAPLLISNAQLKQLAGDRGTTVKNHLIKQLGIKARRLIACRAKVDKQEPEGKPRTDLLL